MKNNVFCLPLLAGLALVLSACGGPSEPEQTLEERVLARWEHMIERDFEAAWEYYTPGFRQTTPRLDFAHDMTRRPVRWTAAEVVGTDCEEELCRVAVELEYRVPGAPSGQSGMRLSRTIEDQWVLLDGQWWFSAN